MVNREHLRSLALFYKWSLVEICFLIVLKSWVGKFLYVRKLRINCGKWCEGLLHLVRRLYAIFILRTLYFIKQPWWKLLYVSRDLTWYWCCLFSWFSIKSTNSVPSIILNLGNCCKTCCNAMTSSSRCMVSSNTETSLWASKVCIVFRVGSRILQESPKGFFGRVGWGEYAPKPLVGLSELKFMLSLAFLGK